MMKKILPGLLLLLMLYLSAATEAKSLDEAQNYLDRGMKLYFQKDYSGALKQFEAGLVICKEKQNRAGIAEFMGSIGIVYDSQGNYLKAREYYDHVQETRKAIGDNRNEEEDLSPREGNGGSLSALSSSLNRLQNEFQALESPGGTTSEEAQLRAYLNLFLESGDFQTALVLYGKKLEEYRKNGNKTGEGLALAYCGMLYFYFNDYDRAIDYYRQALVIHQESGNKKAEGWTLKALGLVYGRLGNLEKALSCISAAEKIHLESGDRRAAGSDLVIRGFIRVKSREYKEALDCFEKALRIQDELKDRSEGARTLSGIGLVWWNLGAYVMGIEYYNLALAINYHNYDQFGAFQDLAGIGLCYAGMKDYDKAIEYLVTAIGLSEGIREQAKVEEYKISWMQDVSVLYEVLIHLYIKQGKSEKAWEYVERAKARAFLDMLGNEKIDSRKIASRELVERERRLSREIAGLYTEMRKEQDRSARKALYRISESKQQELEGTIEKIKVTNPEYASLRSVQVASLAEIRKNLTTDDLLLEYYIGREESYLFLIEKTALKVIKIPLTHKKLIEGVANLRGKILSLQPCNREIRALSEDLLGEKAWQAMKGKKKLLVIPHGGLHYIPFGMLVDAGGNFLVQNYEILVEPSASVWVLCLRKARREGGTLLACALGSQSVSLAADAAPSSVFRNGIPPLPASVDEVKMISRLFPEGSVLIGSKMVSQAVSEEVKGRNLLHFATHGILDPVHPLFSGLVLSDGLLTTKDIFSLELEANLVVLSACNTAGGKFYQGDELVGMSRAFMYAGSPTVVATLWSIDDVSTSLLMKSFYQGLKEGKSEARALQAAQLEIMAEYPHPYYWAAFIPIGETR